MKAVKLTLVVDDDSDSVYLEDTVNLDEDGEGTLYTVKEFCKAIDKDLKKHYDGKLVPLKAARLLLWYLMSGNLDQERDPEYLARAFNLVHNFSS